MMQMHGIVFVCFLLLFIGTLNLFSCLFFLISFTVDHNRVSYGKKRILYPADFLQEETKNKENNPLFLLKQRHVCFDPGMSII